MSLHGSASSERYAFKISEFCATHRISRGKFYQLKAKGLAPRITEVDGIQFISVEDAATWRRERSEASTTTTAAPAPASAETAAQPTSTESANATV
jgi:hypothetical protein